MARQVKLPPHVRKRVDLRRARRRAVALAVGISALVGLVAGIVVTSRGPTGERPAATPTATAPPSPAPPTTPVPAATLTALPRMAGATFPAKLLYLEPSGQGSTLKQLDLRRGRATSLFSLPVPDVEVAASGEYAAYVMIRTASGDEAAPARGVRGTPVVHLRSLGTGRDVVAGEGGNPAWSRDGSRLAATRKSAGGTEVLVLTTKDLRLRPLVRAGPWRIVGWAGERLLLLNTAEKKLWLASLDGKTEPAPDIGAVIRAPSPDGRWLFGVTRRGDAVFQPLAGGAAVVMDLGEWKLGKARWTPDGRVVAAGATDYTEEAPSRVIILDPVKKAVVLMRGTSEAVEAFPASDGGSFIFARGKRGSSWTLWTCLLDGSCRRAGTVPLGVPLVRLE